jgi:hypothetical protein
MQRALILFLAVLAGGGCGNNESNGAAPVHDASNTTVTKLRERQLNCLPSAMEDDTNTSSRVYVSAIRRPPCSCHARSGRPALSAARSSVILHAAQSAGLCDAGGCTTSSFCICEVPRAGGGSLEACLNADEPEGSNGWCYLRPASGIGSDDVVSSCSGEDSQAVRAIGSAIPEDDEMVFLAVEADLSVVSTE